MLSPMRLKVLFVDLPCNRKACTVLPRMTVGGKLRMAGRAVWRRVVKPD